MDTVPSTTMYVCVLFMYYFILNNRCSNGLVVETRGGKVQGLQKNITLEGKTTLMSVFYGIPYGETTSGNNRFKKPIPKAPFTDTFDATKPPIACIQASQSSEALYGRFSNFSEDCLVLNIYVPHDFEDQPFLPVMVWIYGGGFATGASGAYNAEGLAVTGNIIVVTINYRIGMFGFLRSSDGQLIGNQGLWDQQLAIKWVQDNIGAFYGYPDDITLVGESAGSVSVLYQALYPGNKGLFQRVIAESGSPLGYFGLQEPNAEQYIDLIQCKSDVVDPISCLLSLPPEELQIDIGLVTSETLSFRPTVDGDFLKGTPHDILLGNNTAFSQEQQFFASLDIVFGVNSHEGISFLLLNRDLPDKFSTNEFNMTQSLFDDMVLYCIRTMLKPDGGAEQEMIRRLIEFTYTDWDEPDNVDILREHMVSLASDITMFAPAIATANVHAKYISGRTYIYVFSAEPSEHLNPMTPKWIKGSLNFVLVGTFFTGSISHIYNHNQFEYLLGRVNTSLHIICRYCPVLTLNFLHT